MSAPPAADRCAVRADLRGDEMLGTAFPAARLLLVEEPFPWGFEGLRGSRFDRDIAHRLEARGRETGVRIQAIRRVSGRSSDTAPRRWALIDTRPATRSQRWGTYAAAAELLELPFDAGAGAGEPEEEPTFLVCTHGKHDPCCAQRGRPVALALDALAPGRVWQSSHLGGCRFTPTVLTLPSGVMYGRVSPAQAAELVGAVGAGQIVGTLLRGRIGLAPPVQAAVGYAHERLGLPSLDDVTVQAVAPVAPGVVGVTVATPAGPYELHIQGERVPATGLTCASPGPSAYIAHRLASITAVGPPQSA